MASGGTLRFAPAAPQHVPALAALHADAPDPWAAAQLQAELDKPECRAFVVFQDGAPAGFACFCLLGGTAELETMAVARALRGQGLGAALLRRALADLRRQGAARCLLEVRCSNAPAKALYRRLGFEPLALRRGLFSAPREDGETMQLVFDSAPAPEKGGGEQREEKEEKAALSGSGERPRRHGAGGESERC